MKKAEQYLDESIWIFSDSDKAMVISFIKQAQFEAIKETVKACDKNVVSGSMKSRWETVEQQLKSQL